MENESETHIQEGQNLNSIVVASSDKNETDINKEVDLAANSEQNMIPASEDDNACSIDITGSLISLTRKTIDEMYQLHSNYARAIGFRVRKSTTRVKLDDDGRLCNVFWKDSMMKEDYDIFGDVMVFDTTYRINKYNLICAPFVGCVDENEFESCWSSMISDYKLENHPWFNRLYGLKEKWCTALSKDLFSAGILYSQRSESTNHAIGFSAKKNTSLTDFFGIFKEMLKNWRNKEQKDEFQCSRSIPESALPFTGMLKHASEVYTLTLFRDFEAEFFKSISSSSILILVEDGMMVYNVSSHDNDGLSHRVIFDCLSNLITCSCKKFEEYGLLCYHCLRVLHINSIVTIPESYIMKRWTKFAKSEIWDKFNSTVGRSEKVGDCIPWRHEMARKYYNLVLQCQENKEAWMIVEEGYNRDSVAVNALMSSLTITEQSDTSIHSNSFHIVQDPTRSVTKGRIQKIKGHFQKKQEEDNGCFKFNSSKGIWEREKFLRLVNKELIIPLIFQHIRMFL
ncbi:protein FAR1-RELATED SEQUENCE 5-like [Henckelia pumila]|uniref:protein FAR1-RELATED SEQUENCE 5-like n=1 Tax=Henckelia pumila TaxID=405737 RepID=UPI003C6EA162